MSMQILTRSGEGTRPVQRLALRTSHRAHTYKESRRPEAGKGGESDEDSAAAQKVHAAPSSRHPLSFVNDVDLFDRIMDRVTYGLAAFIGVALVVLGAYHGWLKHVIWQPWMTYAASCGAALAVVGVLAWAEWRRTA